MKTTITLLCFLGIIPCLCVGETFRISEVVRQAGEGVEEMTLKNGDREERLWVKKAVVLDQRDVKEAAVVAEAGLEDVKLSVRLTEEGARKMKAVTERLRGERLAIVVDGTVISAPEVLTTLEDTFVISGDFELRELQNLARTMMGQPPLRAGDPDDPPPVPKVKTVPYTQEEYQERKAAREKMGTFYLEKVPSEAELDLVLRPGMTPDEVVEALGPPLMRFRRVDDMMYEIAPEKRPGTSSVPDGFTVGFRDGKVSTWGYRYSDFPREEKVVGREPGLLKMVLPEGDLSRDDFNLISYFEAIKVPNPEQKVSRSDLEDLLTIALQTAAVAAVEPEGKKAATVSADCDLMLTMAHHFPEVAELRSKAGAGRVRLDVLDAALMPYLTNAKPLPLPAADSKSAEATPADAPPK